MSFPEIDQARTPEISETVLLENSSNRQFENSEASQRRTYHKVSYLIWFQSKNSNG